MRPDQRHLVIFTRRPQLGVGKRRLAADIGDLAALRFQQIALDGLLRRLGGNPAWRTWVAISPDRPLAWVRSGKAVPQGGGDLGERLARVVGRLPAGQVVVIGSDTPDIDASDIRKAFRNLGPQKAVLGPAIDGGYWLIGLPHRRRILPFANVRWSTPDTLADTVAGLGAARIILLPTREDVDDLASLRRYQVRSQRNLSVSPS